MLTTDEIRELARVWGQSSDEDAFKMRDAFYLAAETCERLDRIIELLEKETP